MCDPFENRALPRGVFVGVAALIGFTFLVVAAARFGGVGTQTPAQVAVESLQLRFEDRQDGAVVVYEAREDRLLTVLEPGDGSFVRGVLRGLARERRRQDIGARPPFRLVRWADGHLSLEDPSTSQEIALNSFGPSNAQAFAEILMAKDLAR